MSAHTLPPSPSIEHLKNQAKSLLTSFRSRDISAIRRVEAALRLTPFPTSRTLKLSEAQQVIAREYGFASWPKLKSHTEHPDTSESNLAMPIAGDPEARAAYYSMIEAFRTLRSLTAEVRTVTDNLGERPDVEGIARIVLSQPGNVRYESYTTGKLFVTMLVYGGRLRAYWPGTRPRFAAETAEAYIATCDRAYCESAIDLSVTSLSSYHGIGNLTIMPPVIDPSFFFLSRPSVEGRVMAFRSIGTEEIGGVACDIVEMEMTWDCPIRTTRIWIARSDGLPRRAVQSCEGTWRWRKVDDWWINSINDAIDNSVFQWEPDEGWNRWSMPEDFGLISPGTSAPDIAMPLLAGGSLNISKLRGKRIALALGWTLAGGWIQQESARLQRLYDIGVNSNIYVAAWDSFDKTDALLSAVSRFEVTYPILHTSSTAAIEKFTAAYGANASPSFCIIDERGVVVDSWIHDFGRFEATVERLAGTAISR